jgi:GxxExxY protein
MLIEENTTGKILECFYKVYGRLGYGFLEKVYERAMMIELREMGLECRSQAPVSVFYKKELIGNYYADIIVENSVILELKTVETLCIVHEMQLHNYLKATKIEVGLLLNFGTKPSFKRKILTNDRK